MGSNALAISNSSTPISTDVAPAIRMFGVFPMQNATSDSPFFCKNL